MEEAREELRRAKRADPDSQQIRFALISVLRALGDSAALQSELDSFERRKRQIRGEGMAARAADRAATYLEKGEAATALKEYEQALGHDPRNADLQYGRALALSRLGRHPDRVAALERALDLDPSLAAAHNELGLAFGSLGRAQESEAAFLLAIEADPQFAAAKGNLGVLRLMQGRPAEAEPLFRQAVEDDPGSSHMRVNHGLALAALGRFDDAEDAITEALRINPREPKARGALAAIAEMRSAGPGIAPGHPK